jgi:hypothetical protein
MIRDGGPPVDAGAATGFRSAGLAPARWLVSMTPAGASMPAGTHYAGLRVIFAAAVRRKIHSLLSYGI